jgi:dihydroorotate dehydrogenase (NAD+) catalytic subunit
MTFKNPLIIASGPLTRDAKAVNRLARAGAAGVVMKSVSVQPREGYPFPRTVPEGGGFLNAEGLPNPGCQRFREVIRDAKKSEIPIIASIFGFSAGDYIKSARAMEEAGSDALEIIGLLRDLKEMKKILPQIKKRVKIPLIVKMGLRDNLPSIAKTAEDYGADAITAITSIPGLSINIRNCKPRLGSPTGAGGLTGPPIKPIALKNVADITRHVKIPVLASGGISNGPDAIEMLLVGAQAVQILSCAMSKGVRIIPKIVREIESYMEEKGYKTLTDFRGLSLTYLRYVPPSETFYLRQ